MARVIKTTLAVDSGGGVRSVKRVSDSITDMEKKAKISTANITKGFQVVAVAAAAVVGAIALIGKSLIDVASDMEETQGKFNVVFRGLTEDAENWTKTLQDGYAMSELEAKKYLSSLQDLIVPTGMLREEAGKLSFQFVQMAADLGSFNNRATADVIQDMTSAIQGGSETMAKYGINVKAAKIEQEVFRLGLAKNKAEITDADKIHALYNITMREGGDAVGDMARTSGSYANQLKRLHASVDDFKVLLGGELLNVATQYITKLNEWIKGNKELIEQKVPEYMKTLVDGFQLLIDNADALTAAIKGLVVIIITLTAVKFVTIMNAWVTSVVALGAAFKGVGITAWIASLINVAGAASSVSGAFNIMGSTIALTTPNLHKFIMLLKNPYFLGAAAVIGGIAWAFKKLQTSSADAAGALWDTNEELHKLNRNKGIYIINSEIETYTNKLRQVNEVVANMEIFGEDSQLVQRSKKNIVEYSAKIDSLKQSLREANKAADASDRPAIDSYNMPTPTPLPLPDFNTNFSGTKDILHLKNNETQQKKINESVMNESKRLTEELLTYKMDSFQKEIFALTEVHNMRKTLGLNSVEEERMYAFQVDTIKSESAAFQLSKLQEVQEAQKSSLQKWVEDTQSTNDMITNIVSQTTDSIADGLTDAMFDFGDSSLSAGEKFKQFASETLKAIAKMIVQFAILKAVKAGLSAWGFADGGVAPGGFEAAANGAVWKGGFQAFASGGKVTKPTVGLIGEGRYNEAIVPLPDGNSIPVEMKGGSGGSVNVVNNITIDKGAGGSDNDKANFANQIALQIKQSVVEIISQEKRYGGVLYGGIR